jgi:hypothetical protein
MRFVLNRSNQIYYMPFEPPANDRFPQERPNIADQLAVGKDVYFYHPGLKQMHRGTIEKINQSNVVLIYILDGKPYKHTALMNNIRKVF